MVADPAEGEHVDGVVELAVAAAVQAVAISGAPGGDRTVRIPRVAATPALTASVFPHALAPQALPTSPRLAAPSSSSPAWRRRAC